MGTMNELINPSVVATLSGILRQAASAIDLKQPLPLTELEATATALDELSLRQRSDLLSAALISDLHSAAPLGDLHNAAPVSDPPGGYSTAAAIFRRALDDEAFAGWMMWPVTETVTTLALADASSAAFDDALALLAELTPRLTSEFAIRRLLEHNLERALTVIEPWTTHPNEHVRRLASEGTRSFLPWAIRVRALVQNPRATAPILNALRADDSEYVRRSVANHLNDLARIAPTLVTDLAGEWMTDPRPHDAWVIRHGLRTLIKKGDPAALALLGFDPVEVTVTTPQLVSETVGLPGELEFAVEITNTSSVAGNIAVDYVVHYRKANGQQAPKVFKLTTATLQPGQSVKVRKRHAFRQMTTRVHYPGVHGLEVQVNGQRHGATSFHLGESAPGELPIAP
ncbi:MAG TPA: DNA alkylation repair protein [Glaciihabitans sp.]|nr:DNA alkylation repair protein [Glaciihabitans sp.]